MSSMAPNGINPSASKKSGGDGDTLYAWTERPSSQNKKSRTGEIKAKNKTHAKVLLRRQGVNPNSIQKMSSPGTGGVPLLQVATMVRQLSVMLQSSVPLSESLGLISANMSGKKSQRLREIVRSIRGDVESGIRLSDSMRKHPKCFDTLFCNTLAAGEEAGQLEDVMLRLALHMEKVLRTRQKIRKAMMYPGIVVLVATAVTVGMLLFVLPTFEKIYGGFGAELPALTQGLLQTSHFLQERGLYLLGGLIVGGYLTIRSYKYNVKFKNILDKLLLKLPLFGLLLRTASFARWNRTMATLSHSGVPIVNALESVASLAGLQIYQDATFTMRQDVSSGVKVSDSMEKTQLFPIEMSQLIRIGEESGRLDQMLERLAVQYETKLDDLVDNLSTIMEPAIMTLIGGIVGTLIIGMYMPIFDLGKVV